MTPQRWQQIKTTLSGALDCEDTRQRGAFLDDACGDDRDLRERVQTLLDQPEDEFDTFADTLGLTARQSASSQRIGAYALIRELGRGGMGAVWLARRADQVFEKLVAIKILKRGTDTDEVLRRFDAERQILARLEHPNIARLLDAGTTDDDLPYFVMEYIDGRRLTDFVAEKKLSLGDRLRLFLKICSAVQFAHQNLVVHRDLKPGNILVTADAEPKLLDFGVAKLLGPGDEALLMTVPGEQRFTPAYTSPEQLRGEPVTTLSDIYSAGTLLYEMLTGANAHRFATQQPPPTELLRVVAQEEPLRPSAAANDPATKRRLRGDLDNIILKALRKEPSRRYSSMSSLAADVQRYLENRPVTAQRDTVGYRAGKFVQRNKLGVGAALLVLLTLIGGLIGIAWQARIARERFNDVRHLAHAVLFDYHDSIADLPGSTAVREKLVRDSLDYLDRLSKQAGQDRSLRREIAAAYLKVADVQGQPNFPNLGHATEAMQGYQKALGLWENIVAAEPSDTEAISKLATVHSRIGELLRDKGDLKVAVEHHRKAIALMEPLFARNDATPEIRETLALCYTTLADVLGNPVLVNVGDFAGAMENYERGLKIRDQLVAEDSTSVEKRKWAAVSHQRIGAMLDSRKDYSGAFEHFQQAREIDEGLLKEDPISTFKQRALALDYQYLSITAWNAEQVAQARDYQEQDLRLAQELVARDPNNAAIKITLATGYIRMLYMVGRGGDLAGAHEYERKMRQLMDPLIARDPTNVGYLGTVRGADQRIADIYLRAGDGEKALPYVREALKLNDKMFALQPANTNARRGQAASHAQFGQVYKLLAHGDAAQENWQHARAEYQESLEIYRELAAKGALVGAEATKPDEIAKELASCEAALASTR